MQSDKMGKFIISLILEVVVVIPMRIIEYIIQQVRTSYSSGAATQPPPAP